MRWVFGLILGFAFVTSATAEVPQKLHYNGYLTNAVGDPVDCPDAIQCGDSYDLTFSIYQGEADEVALWQETHSEVPLYQGSFSALLGNVSTLTAADLESAKFLSIRINDGDELLPRQHIASAPFAIRASVAEQALNADDATSLGGVEASAYATQESVQALQGDINTVQGNIAPLAIARAVKDIELQGNIATLDASLHPIAKAGLPADLADGDDDTLGALSCTEGQVPIQNAGAWSCVDAPLRPPGAAGTAGATGPAGAVTLVDRSPEPEGANCENGGVKVDTGVDLNANSVLDTDEVQGTSYVCNGGMASGGSATLPMGTEPPGQCNSNTAGQL